MISLIIPVYNKAPFLGRCLDSVVKQTNKTSQIIIVDDGSTDGSAEICDKYKEKFGFEVYHTENKGVSSARNFGMSKAKGEYISFLDADDILMPDAIDCMNRAANKNRNICQFSQFRTRSFENINYIPYSSPKGSYNFSFIPRYWVMVWNKIYKRSFINENKIRFKEGMQFGEDALFNARCILANGGLYHADCATIIHCMDDRGSLCRGTLTLDRIKLLDEELCNLADKQTESDKISWMKVAINEHRNSHLYKKFGFSKRLRGLHDIVYFVKERPTDEELIYSLRSVEENWRYKNVWFCGGCPNGLKPDKMFYIKQDGLDKWDKVRRMIVEVCKNDEITENFWLFNDDFYVLKPFNDNMDPQYNGDLISYVERIEEFQGTADEYTIRLRNAAERLKKDGYSALNYEVHKPMLINRKKALEVLEKYPDTPAFRSLYGNYWKIGGVSKHDMKIKMLKYPKMSVVENNWEFLSTSDTSFRDGNVGEFVRSKFNKKSRFEEEKLCVV